MSRWGPDDRQLRAPSRARPERKRHPPDRGPGKRAQRQAADGLRGHRDRLRRARGRRGLRPLPTPPLGRVPDGRRDLTALRSRDLGAREEAVAAQDRRNRRQRRDRGVPHPSAAPPHRQVVSSSEATPRLPSPPGWSYRWSAAPPARGAPARARGVEPLAGRGRTALRSGRRSYSSRGVRTRR